MGPNVPASDDERTVDDYARDCKDLRQGSVRLRRGHKLRCERMYQHLLSHARSCSNTDSLVHIGRSGVPFAVHNALLSYLCCTPPCPSRPPSTCYYDGGGHPSHRAAPRSLPTLLGEVPSLSTIHPVDIHQQECYERRD